MENLKRTVVFLSMNVPLADFLAINMEKHGYEVFIAPDIQSALFLIKTAHPSYVIVDALLPGLGTNNVFSFGENKNELVSVPIIVLDTSAHELIVKFPSSKKVRQDVEPEKLVASLSDVMK